jgi:hypothetical protein
MTVRFERGEIFIDADESVARFLGHVQQGDPFGQGWLRLQLGRKHFRGSADGAALVSSLLP